MVDLLRVRHGFLGIAHNRKFGTGEVDGKIDRNFPDFADLGTAHTAAVSGADGGICREQGKTGDVYHVHKSGGAFGIEAVAAGKSEILPIVHFFGFRNLFGNQRIAGGTGIGAQGVEFGVFNLRTVPDVLDIFQRNKRRQGVAGGGRGNGGGNRTRPHTNSQMVGNGPFRAV